MLLLARTVGKLELAHLTPLQRSQIKVQECHVGPDHGLVLVEHLDAPLGERPPLPRLPPEPDLAEQVEVDGGDRRRVDPAAVPGPGAREREADPFRAHPGLPAPQQKGETRHLAGGTIQS